MRGLLIFDVDGTLLDTRKVTVPAVQRVQAAFGMPVSNEAEILRFVGLPAEEHKCWLADQAPPGQAGAAVARVLELELEYIRRGDCLFPGAAETLDALRRAGYALAVCSNGDREYVQAVLDAHRISGLFAAVKCNENGAAGKTAMVAEILRAVAFRPVAVIGDRKDDVDAALANGAIPIGASYGFGGDVELRGAPHRIDAVTELPGILDEILSAMSRDTKSSITREDVT